jgi:transaldolase
VKDPAASPNLYVEALAAPEPSTRCPRRPCWPSPRSGKLCRAPWPPTAADAEQVLQQFARAGIDVDRLAIKLQQDGAQAFVKSWEELLERIAAKSTA